MWMGGREMPADAVTSGFDTDNKLIVGNIKDFSGYNFRDFVQFKPALIIDGELQVHDSAGWGVQPRSAMGQSADGKVVLVAIDGRQPLHSVGATVLEVAKIMQAYGVINAGCCDGGSTTVMAYDGKLITKPSTDMADGRYLPNALLILKRKARI
jgi:exopolysaccharide biosynthesis protein